jgi:hypothetical protein
MKIKTGNSIRVDLCALLLGIASATTLVGEVDAREVIRRTVIADQQNWKVARNYSSLERVESRRLDSLGQLKSKEVTNYDITLPEGSLYRRLTGRDDGPLPPVEAKKEQEKLDRSIAERRKETATQRAQRLAAYAERPEWVREAWRELPDAFDFRLVGEQKLESSSVYVIEATPRQGYQPRSSTAKVLPHLRAKLWVNTRDYQLEKAEIEVIDNVWFGLFLVRLAKGSRAIIEQTRLNDEVWMPLRLRASGSARIGLLKVLNIEHEVSYSKFQEFQTDSTIVSRRKNTPCSRSDF